MRVEQVGLVRQPERVQLDVGVVEDVVVVVLVTALLVNVGLAGDLFCHWNLPGWSRAA